MTLGYPPLLSQDLQQGLGAGLLFTLNPMADSLLNRIAVQIQVALIQPGC